MIRHVLPIITAGIANRIMIETTSIAQTNSGTRFSDMPGARILKNVTAMQIAATSDASSENVISCAHTSARFPYAYSGPDSGGYANQPTSGPTLRANMTYRNSPP